MKKYTIDDLYWVSFVVHYNIGDKLVYSFDTEESSLVDLYRDDHEVYPLIPTTSLIYYGVSLDSKVVVMKLKVDEVKRILKLKNI